MANEYSKFTNQSVGSNFAPTGAFLAGPPPAGPPPDINIGLEIIKQTVAEAFYERLTKSIEDFQKGVDPDEQILATYSSANGQTIIVEKIGFYNPNLIRFFGIDSTSGRKTHVLVHQNCVALILTAVKVEPEKKPRRIGFLADK